MAHCLSILCSLAWLPAAGAEQSAPPAPPNEPAALLAPNGGARVELRYHGAAILRAEVALRRGDREVSLEDAAIPLVTRVPRTTGPHVGVTQTTSGGGEQPCEQRVAVELVGGAEGDELVLRATASASDEAFPAETRGTAQARFPLVRNSDGLSRNLRNNAVYDRKWDWVLVGPDGATTIQPLEPDEAGRRFSVVCTGRRTELVFRPRFYQKHKGIRYFEPWTYRIWPESVAGWCSWWPYHSDISEEIVARESDVFARKLRDYGFSFVQIDDGYQSSSGGRPEQWLATNDRFPSGLSGLAGIIRGHGLKPAIWTNVHIGDESLVREHPEWFVHDADGSVHKGPWIDFGLDGSRPEAVDAVIRPHYRALREMGWSYLKMDALRHLLYDAYYPCRDYLASRGSTPEDAFRAVLGATREEIGRETYMLACWGVLPEAVGVVDACRLGGDGFGPTTLGQYSSWNNVVWRNDPDHVDITPDGEDIIRPVLTSMAGAQMLLTDRAEVYESDAKIEGARRSCPVPVTVPGQLYDFDPSRTDNVIRGLRNEHGGGAEGPIDAAQHGPTAEWWMLEIDRPFEHWAVLARLSWSDLPAVDVSLGDLGLDPDAEYLIYEFWSRTFVGSAKGSFAAPAQRAREVHVWAIRSRLDHPQVVSTSRHITQGGPDLEDITWDQQTLRLSGVSKVVAGDPYTATVTVPAGLRAVGVVSSAPTGGLEERDGIAAFTLSPTRTGEATWAVAFSRDGAAG